MKFITKLFVWILASVLLVYMVIILSLAMYGGFMFFEKATPPPNPTPEQMEGFNLAWRMMEFIQASIGWFGYILFGAYIISMIKLFFPELKHLIVLIKRGIHEQGF